MHRHARPVLPILALTASSLLAGCSTPAAEPSAARTTVTTTVPAAPSSTTPTPTSPASPRPPASGTSTGPAPAKPSTRPTVPTPRPTGPAPSCAAVLVDRMTPQQRAGQLVMVGVTTGGVPSAHRAVQRHHVGGVFLLGGWRGRGPVAGTTRALQDSARGTGARLPLLVAADQEGGKVQGLRGEGFAPAPSAADQGRGGEQEVRRTSTRIARELAAAGVGVDLAPVADVVDPALGRANQPVGRWGRDYDRDPARAAVAVRAAVEGLHAGGVATAVKHFPGLGRVRGNTDFTRDGIDDPTTTRRDPVLRPFAEGIAAGTDMVMVSTARYPRIDPDAQAAFSPVVITQMLRGDLGFRGVVASDDMGAARSVAHVPMGERAVRFVRAGGDLALAARPAQGEQMAQALVEAAGADPRVAAQVRAAATRVVDLKVRRGLARCG